MKVPTWATVIGVLMILFGGCGVLNNVQKINTPKTLDQSSGMIAEITRELEEAVEEQKKETASEDSLDTRNAEDTINANDRTESFKQIRDSMGKMLNFSDYYKKWIVRIGYIGVFVSIFYAIAGVLLVMGRQISIKITYLAIGLSLSALFFQIIVLAMDDESGMIAGMTNIGAYFMIFVNILVLVVILASDKSYFYQTENHLS